MNGTTLQSPEQRHEVPQPVGQRLHVTDIAGRFIEAALQHIPEVSATPVPLKNTVEFQPQPQVDEIQAGYVPAPRVAAFKLPNFSEQGMSAEDMAQDARNKIAGLN